MEYDLTNLSITDVLQMSAQLQAVEASASNMEECAGEVVRYLHANLHAGATGQACALVRLYRIMRFADLDVMLRGFARSMAKGLSPGEKLSDNTACLTLIATAGDQPEWNARQRSLNHQAIPLLSEEVVQQMPMVAQLFQQLGYDVRDVLAPDPTLLIDISRRTHNVFWVQEARGNPYIPAQEDFVIRYGIRSVVGFGGVLSGGELFAVVLFSKHPIQEEQARRFSSLAVTVRGVLSACGRNAVFATGNRLRASEALK